MPDQFEIKYDFDLNRIGNISKNLEWIKKYEIKKNKIFREIWLEEHFENKNSLKFRENNLTPQINTREKSYKSNYHKLNRGKSVKIMPLDNDLFSIRPPIKLPHVSHFDSNIILQQENLKAVSIPINFKQYN